MKQVAVCPECDQLVVWTSFLSNGNLFYHCGNCHHHVNQFSLDRLPQNTLPDCVTRIGASFEPDHEKK